MNHIRIKVGRDNAPPAVATPDGLPDVSTQQNTRHNAKLLWQACAELASDGTANTRHGRPGVLYKMAVGKIIGNMWDGYSGSPMHSPSTNARRYLYDYLRDSGNMVCTERGGNSGGMWWIAREWQDKPAEVKGTWTERRLSKDEAGETRDAEPVEIRYVCQYPGCDDTSEYLPTRMGHHIRTHGITSLAAYKAMAADTEPWPGTETAAVAEEAVPIVAAPGDPLVAVESLVAEVKRLRALTANDDLISENHYLRGKLDETLASNAKLRQRLEAADRVLGRR